MKRPFIALILVWVLAACGQSGQTPPTVIQASIPSPSIPLASPTSAPTATIAATTAPATAVPPLPYPPPANVAPDAPPPPPTIPSILAGPEASSTISGRVSYPAELTLPPDGLLTIELLEIRPNDQPLDIVRQSISPLDPNQQRIVSTAAGMHIVQATSAPTAAGPIPFEIKYNPTFIDPQKEYVLSAKVSQAGQPLFVGPWYPVLSQGHPATVEIVLEAQSMLRGTVAYPAKPALPSDAVLTVQLVNQSLCGSSSCPILGEQIITPIGQSPAPFVLAYNSAIIDPQWTYVVIAQISAPSGLNWRTEQPFPAQGQPATIDLALAPPPAVAQVTGTAIYPAQPALPPGAVLTVQLVSLTEVGISGPAIVGTQTIPLDGHSPVPFTIDYDPAIIQPLYSYAVDAWISVPGRLDWRPAEPALVLTQGHPTTADITLAPPPAVAAVSGTISYPAQPALPPDARLTILLADAGKGADLSALAEAHITPVGPGPIPFTLEYDPTRLDPQKEYAVYAMVHGSEQDALVITTPYPVITHGHPTTVDAVLQPATVTTVSGTITYRMEQPLPPNARLEIWVEGFVGGDTPSTLGKQAIAPVGPGPIPFAITVAPAMIAKQQLYRVNVWITNGEEMPLGTAYQRAFAYAPVEVVVEPLR